LLCTITPLSAPSLHDALPISCTAPAGTFRRPKTAGPVLKTGDRPGGHAPPQGFAGGINPAPTNKFCVPGQTGTAAPHRADVGREDRKSTRLNSSHVSSSYAVF